MEMKTFVNLEERVEVGNGQVDFVATIISDTFKEVDEYLTNNYIEKIGNLVHSQYGLNEEEYDKFYDIIEKNVIKFDSLKEFITSREFKNIIAMLQSAFTTRFFESVLHVQDLETCIIKGHIEDLRHMKNKNRIVKKDMKLRYLQLDCNTRTIRGLEEVIKFAFDTYIDMRDKVVEFANN